MIHNGVASVERIVYTIQSGLTCLVNPYKTLGSGGFRGGGGACLIDYVCFSPILYQNATQNKAQVASREHHKPVSGQGPYNRGNRARTMQWRHQDLKSGGARRGQRFDIEARAD